MERAPKERGIPDALLVGVLAFVLGLTVLVWTATGLSGLFAHGAWPDQVTFTNTPQAMRALAARPHDLPGAWPTTPAPQLSGYGLFWGLLIGQLMILMVLTIFTLGTWARWRTVRRNRARGGQLPPQALGGQSFRGASGVSPVRAEPRTRGRVGTTPEAPHRPEPVTPETPLPVEQEAPTPPPPEVPLPPQRTHLLYGPVETRRPTTLQHIHDAEGPALVVTSDPTIWSETKDARAKLGPVLVYDPGHLCDTPARLHWSPTAHCEDPETAHRRAVALLAPVRPHSRLDSAVADTAETLLRCWLHAAAVDGLPFKQVHRWAQNNGAHEPVRILRTHPKATNSQAGLLESALTAYPERRQMAQELTARALSSLSSIHIRDACTPNRSDALALESFVHEGGTLYVVGEPIEDPRTRPAAMPLLTALASSVVEHGRRMAARSSDGRLDPPLTLVLDDVAAVAPLPALPELLADGHERGLPTTVLLRSQEQARARWPEPLPG
ncbi:type IV secretory system conjugative DNA transfer family protein [Streptomyces sp. NPDC001941]|uniref:type IV secretory system conjugative DNA transfer family protein n=1 Tax=Streptomyces sp. NPDC001941 TaxID=3154659 RepID=UPI00331B5000